MSMSAFPGERSFDAIVPSIFRVEARSSAGVSQGTGFVIGMYKESRKLLLATAKHVLDVPEAETVRWKIERFATNLATKGRVPYSTHDKLDVGIIRLTGVGANGQPTARPDEQPVRVIHVEEGVSPGTRVAWAGFPAVVEDALGFPQLCYFEVVISAMVDQGGKQVYVVDGHGNPGVSGGPVWHWSREHKQLEVVGIVCQYWLDDDGLPGFCLFEPINLVMEFLESQAWHLDKVGDQLVTNRRIHPSVGEVPLS
jgi:hypothetical protein